MAAFGNQVITDRLARHEAFVRERAASGKQIKHTSRIYGFPVVTKQETDIFFHLPLKVDAAGDGLYKVAYRSQPLNEDLFSNNL